MWGRMTRNPEFVREDGQGHERFRYLAFVALNFGTSSQSKGSSAVHLKHESTLHVHATPEYLFFSVNAWHTTKKNPPAQSVRLSVVSPKLFVFPSQY